MLGSRRKQGTCTTSAGESVTFRVGDPEGVSGHGIRAFAGVRWDPFIMDAPAALKTIATRKLAFTDPSAIYLDGKNVLSIVVEIDTGALGDAPLVGVVAETLTRGRLNVRIERVGRPEVKNMMLAPKQFDTVNRDLEIRDLYNMEDAFHLGDSYQGAYRARLNANLAFWDGLDGKTDWTLDENGESPAHRAGSRRLPRRRRHQTLCRTRVVPGDRTRCPSRRTTPNLRGTRVERRRHRHAVHPADQRRERAGHPRRGRPLQPTRWAGLSVPLGAEPRAAQAPRPPPLAIAGV